MPSFFSGAPKLTPASDFSTTKAEMPAGPGGRVGDGEDGVVLGDAGVGDPALHAVEHPVIAVAHRPGGHRRRVAARLRLGQAVREHRLAGGDRRQVALLELLRPGQQQRHGAELVHRRDQRGRGAGPGHLLDHDGGGERVRAGAAVLGRDVRGVEVGGPQRLVATPAGTRRSRRPRRRSGRPWPSQTSRTASRIASCSSGNW